MVLLHLDVLHLLDNRHVNKGDKQKACNPVQDILPYEPQDNADDIRITKRPDAFGNCEADELYMHCGMKGKNYHDMIIASGRNPRRRAVKPPPGRGRFERDFPMVMCYHKRGGDTIFAVPQSYDSIASLVCSVIAKGSRTNTDEYRAYNLLESPGYDHRAANCGLKEYARGDIHTNNCECRTALLKLWMAKHRGVNKFNLGLYLKTFQFIHNMRELDDYAKFLRILSVVYMATRFYIKSVYFFD